MNRRDALKTLAVAPLFGISLPPKKGMQELSTSFKIDTQYKETPILKKFKSIVDGKNIHWSYHHFKTLKYIDFSQYHIKLNESSEFETMKNLEPNFIEEYISNMTGENRLSCHFKTESGWSDLEMPLLTHNMLRFDFMTQYDNITVVEYEGFANAMSITND